MVAPLAEAAAAAAMLRVANRREEEKISFRERERKRLSSLQHSWECRMTAWRQIHIDRASSSSSSSNLNFLTFSSSLCLSRRRRIARAESQGVDSLY
jgi:hypothetical protein